MKSRFTLNRETHLPIIREAFANKTLQMFNEEQCKASPSCLYQGPCAVGVVLPDDLRLYFDGGISAKHDPVSESVYSLFNEGELDSGGNDEWWEKLQSLHDAAASALHRKLTPQTYTYNPSAYDAAVRAFAEHIGLIAAQRMEENAVG